MVEDINLTGGSFPDWLTNVNGTLYFAATDGVDGFELCKSDASGADDGRGHQPDRRRVARTGSPT